MAEEEETIETIIGTNPTASSITKAARAMAAKEITKAITIKEDKVGKDKATIKITTSKTINKDNKEDSNRKTMTSSTNFVKIII